MKLKIFLLCLIVYFDFSLSSFLNSQTFNIQCTRRPLTSIKFISPTKAWIYGGEIAYKSADGGANWSFPISQTPPVNEPYFVDSLYGWACKGESDIIYKTSNGGLNWSIYEIYCDYCHFNNIFFTNRNTGWIVGHNVTNTPLIIKTTNGGVNWNSISNNLTFVPSQLYMFNESKGIAIPVSGVKLDTCAMTTDGGYSWNYIRAGLGGQSLIRILFIDSLNGWLLGNTNYISKTTNGGLNWIYYNSLGNNINMFFLNSMTGWVTTDDNYIFKTTNSGANFIAEPASIYSEYYNGIYFKNANTGWAISNLGTVIKSTNGGDNWFNLIDPPRGNINGLYFTNITTGYCATQNGFISMTTNSGNNWTTSYSTNVPLHTVKFVDANKGFVVGDGGAIIKTSNGGINWYSQTISANSFNSIFFIDSINGFISGTSGQILKTTDAGLNWINVPSGSSATLNSIKFVNYNTGFSVGYGGTILRTTDNGINWSISQPFGDIVYRDLFFINNSTGFVIGNQSYMGGYYFWMVKYIIKTTNAGSNWSMVSQISVQSTQQHSYWSIYFTDTLTGWIATRNDGVLKSDNGGITWYSFYYPPDNDKFTSLYFINHETCWFAGGYGYSYEMKGGSVHTTGNFQVGIRNNGSVMLQMEMDKGIS